MKSMLLTMPLLAGSLMAVTPVAAQVGPALNPTTMTGWAGTAEARRQARERQGLDRKRTVKRCSYYAKDPALRCPTKRRSRTR
ncbi:hypothetical protein ACWGNZ_23105 (plasmid) [Sphingomonas zeae]|jgi:hypothetical protein